MISYAMRSNPETVEAVIRSIRRSAAQFAKDGQSALAIKARLWADRFEEAVKAERKTRENGN